MDVVLASPGKYVVAVSGGVDSMALLHLLRARPGLELVVAHFDHGIRPDSAADRQLVEKTARHLDLPFIYKEARLGAGTSEAKARDARYAFLRKALKDTDSKTIVTAHHQDDVLETAIINILRGSGRKGLTALASRNDVERPLLNVSKSKLIAYAKDQDLTWREDSTNQNTDYLRNYVRHQLLPRFDAGSRDRLKEIIVNMRDTNSELDELLMHELRARSASGQLDRQWFTRLPHAVAMETMAAWLRDNGLRDFDSKTLERLVIGAKTAGSGKSFDVLHGATLAVSNRYLALTAAER